MNSRSVLNHATPFMAALAMAGCSDSIHDYVSRGEIEYTQLTLDRDPGQIALANPAGKTPLHYAITYGQTEVLQMLLRKGANLKTCDVTGLTALHVAAFLNRTDEAKLLLDYHADIEARDQFGDTPLHTAAMQGRMEMVQLLLESGADKLAMNNENLTPIELARKNRKKEVVAFFRQWDISDD